MKTIKNLTKALIVLVVMSCTSDVMAERVNVVSRTKTGCFPGCGTTSRTEERVEYVLASGQSVHVIEVSIDCSGTGFNSCPTSSALQGGSPTFDDNCSDVLLNYAYAAVENSILSGTHAQTFLNTETSESFVFDIVWNVVIENGTPTSTFTVFKTFQ